MPTVPYIDQSASPDPQYSAPGVAAVRNAAPEQQEALGQATQRGGNLAFGIGETIGDRLGAQVDDARVKQAEAAALAQAQTINYDPQNGYLNQRGQSAIDQYEPAKQAVAKAFQDQLDNLGNPIQKLMFRQVQQQHLLSIGQAMATHNFQQTSQYSGEAAVSRATSYAQMAANAAQSYGQTDADGNATGDFAKHLQVAEQETLNATRILKGAPADSDVAKEALLGVHTQIGTGALTQMMDARAPYSKVQAMYDDMKAKGWLDMRAMDTLGKMVKTYSEQEIVRTAVNDNLSDAMRASQEQPTTSTGTPDYQFPIKGASVTASAYDPERGAVALNVAQGSNIQAPAAGKVAQVGRDAEGDFQIRLEHADGSVTTFAGLSAANVKVGDQVQRGENVAISGATDADGAVLWSLADKNGNAVDPTKAGLAPVDITKVTDEKVLSAALTGLRAQITDPYLQQQATSEMESIVRHNQQMANAAATQLYKQASDVFYSGGMNWRKIPPSLFNQITPEQRQQFKDLQTEHVLRQYNQGQAFRTMSEVDLVSDFINNPEMLTPENVDAARPQLANSTYLQMMRQANEQRRNPDGVVEASALNDRVKYYASRAGINVDGEVRDWSSGKMEAKKPTPEDKQRYIDLTKRVNDAIDQIKAQNKGKATADQVDKAIQQQLITTTFVTPRGSTVRYNFQVPAGAAGTAIGSDKRLYYVDASGRMLGSTE